jgi:hypothetical protein
MSPILLSMLWMYRDSRSDRCSPGRSSSSCLKMDVCRVLLLEIVVCRNRDAEQHHRHKYNMPESVISTIHAYAIGRTITSFSSLPNGTKTHVKITSRYGRTTDIELVVSDLTDEHACPKSPYLPIVRFDGSVHCHDPYRKQRPKRVEIDVETRCFKRSCLFQVFLNQLVS